MSIRDSKDFETWYIENWHDGDIHPNQSLLNLSPYDADEYIDQGIQKMWEAWQQAKEGNSKWIRCSDKLPDESGYYLVWASTGQIYSGHFAKKAEQWGLGGYPEVTHWQPLPEPPEGFWND